MQTIVQFPGNLSAVEDLAALRQVSSTTLAAKASYLVQGRDAFGDTLGSIFAWDPGLEAADDGESIIRPADRTPLQAGRWVAVVGTATGGSANISVATVAALKATPTDAGTVSLTEAGNEGIFIWTVADYTGQADDINIVKQDDTALSVGAWVRQSSASILYQPLGEAEPQRVQEELRRRRPSPEHFYKGADGSNWSPAIQRTIAHCQDARRGIQLTDGFDYTCESSIILDGPPCTFSGHIDDPAQQGSALPPGRILWTGGSEWVFTAYTGNWNFIGFGLENRTTGKGMIRMDSTTSGDFGPAAGQRFRFERLGLAFNSYDRWSDAMFSSRGNNFGYSVYRDCTFLGAAPKLFSIDGNGASNGLTPISILGFDNLGESNSGGNVVMFELINTQLDRLNLSLTANQQVNELTLVDTRDNASQAQTIGILNFFDSEIDIANPSGDEVAIRRMMYLSKVKTAIFSNIEMQGGGTQTALFELMLGTKAYIIGGNLARLAGPLFNVDNTSRVNVLAPPNVNVGNTQGLVNDLNSAVQGDYPLTYGTTVTLLGQLLDPGQAFRITVTDGNNWTLSLGHPGIGPGGYFYKGQQFEVVIANASGGPMGTVSAAGGSTYWRLTGDALPAPANGFNVKLRLIWNGTRLEERGRSAEIPN